MTTGSFCGAPDDGQSGRWFCLGDFRSVPTLISEAVRRQNFAMAASWRRPIAGRLTLACSQPQRLLLHSHLYHCASAVRAGRTVSESVRSRSWCAGPVR